MKNILLINIVILYFIISGCTEKNNHYREIQINRELMETREFIVSEVRSKYQIFESRKASLIVQRGSTTHIDYWLNKSRISSNRAERLYQFLEEQESNLLDGESYSSWEDLESMNSLNNKQRASNMFLTSINGITKGMIIKDSLKLYLEDLLELVLNYKHGPKEYHFKFPKHFNNSNLDFKRLNPRDTAWVSKLVSKYSDIIEGNINGRWDELQFKDATIIEGLNVFGRFMNFVRLVELEVVDFMLNKVEVFTSCGIPNILEYRAIGEAKTIRKGEDMEVEIQLILRKDGSEFDIIYGVNDNNERNWKPTNGKFMVKGDKIGINKVFGKVRTKQEGEIRWLPFEYEFNVLE